MYVMEVALFSPLADFHAIVIGGKQKIKRQKTASSFEFSIQSKTDFLALHWLFRLIFSIAI